MTTTTIASAPTVATTPTSLHVGGTAIVSSEGYAANVTLDRVIDNPSISTTLGTVSTQGGNEPFSGLEFTVTNIGSTAFTSGGQEHETNLLGVVFTTTHQMLDRIQGAVITGCADLGTLKLEPGRTILACEVFQLPVKADVTYVSVQMDTGIGGSYGNWHVP